MRGRILVTGATGRSGSAVVALLAKRGLSVRALVRDIAKAEALLGELPVEIVRGEFEDKAGVARALEDIDKLFLVVGGRGCVTGLELDVVELARRARIEHIVKISGGYPVTTPTTTSPVGAMHWRVEQAIVATGIPFTFLRPGLFAPMVFGAFRDGTMPHYRYRDGRLPRVCHVDVRDLAAVAAAALTEPGHAGKTYEVTGAAPLTFEDRVAILEALLGTKIRTPSFDADDPRRSDHIPTWYRSHVDAVRALVEVGAYGLANDTVESVTGRKPISFEQFAADHVDSFRALLAGAGAVEIMNNPVAYWK